MALNHASHNPAGEETGPVSGQPPPPSDDAKAAILEAANGDMKGHSAPGKDGGDPNQGKKEKSERELAKERQKAEKLAKLAAKQEKQKAQQIASQPKQKEKKQQEKLPPYKEETPPGEKKILRPLDDEYYKAYLPGVVESAWYAWWEAEGFFKPEFKADGNVKDKGYFSIPIPPPNITGALHIGHALGTGIQDALIRWHRMRGFTTVYLPGVDHAGLSTQVVIENMLYYKKGGMTRHDLGREKFIELGWQWKDDYHQRINNSLRLMGASLDWSRESFTMNPAFSAAVHKSFTELHSEGLLYRGNRLVNWCCQLATSLSNLEVDQKELDGPTKLEVPGYSKPVECGSLWSFKYPIDGTNETIEVATTRPETLLGDTGVAVHPDDDRYKHLIGKFVKHPFVDRLLPIFGDPTVEKDFGSGAVKITPAHDFNDFRRGKEYNLEFVNILNDDGTMNENAGPLFVGQKRFDVRVTVIAELEKLGLYVGKTGNPMSVPLCGKTKDIIEPLIRKQWWMHMKPLAGPAIDVVTSGQIKIKPPSAEAAYLRWMQNIEDWCCSRQLWWGLRIPAWYVLIEGGPSYDSDPNNWVCGENEDEARSKAALKFPGKKFSLVRDPDVLDTWWSSQFFAISSLGWPEETDDLKKLTPCSTLDTGSDIIFFWVARMIMATLKMRGKVPFYEVLARAILRDAQGRKMSKSLGNVISPLDLVFGTTLQDLLDQLQAGNLPPKEIKRATEQKRAEFPNGIEACGADALRFSLLGYMTVSSHDVNFDPRTTISCRHFCNKIFQATRFVLGQLPSDFKPQKSGAKSGKESLPERYILHQMNRAAREVNDALTERDFARATQALYSYWYSSLCDVYIENSKTIIREGTPAERQSALDTLYTALEAGLTMMHPFMPFITEELWQRLPRRPGDTTKSIMIAEYPEHDPSLDDLQAAQEYEIVQGCGKAIRSLFSEYAIKQGGRAFVQPLDQEAHKIATAEASAIKTLSGKVLSSLTILDFHQEVPAQAAPSPVSSRVTIFLALDENLNADSERKRAQSKLGKAAGSISEQQKLIAALADNVASEVREREQYRLKELQYEQNVWEEAIGRLDKLKLK